MVKIMIEFVRLLVIGFWGILVSVVTVLEEFTSVLIGVLVGLATLVFLILQIVKICKDIQYRNLEIMERRRKQGDNNFPDLAGGV